MRRLAQPVGDAEAFVVDLHRHDACAAGDEGVAGADRAGVLEPDMVAGVEQQRADQEEGLLRAGHDEHLVGIRSEEHTSELQSLMRISYAVFCLKKKKTKRW